MIDVSKMMDVMVVCIPIFAVMGMGKFLSATGRLNQERRVFINWLVYNFALPALILNKVAEQDFFSFFNPVLTLLPLTAIALLALVTMLLAKALRYRQAFAAAFVFGTFWANVTYMGFPLCLNAFGEKGLGDAAIYNAFVMPAFVILGYALIGIYGGGKNSKPMTKIRRAALNPVVLSAFLGIGVALLGELFRDETHQLCLPPALYASVRLCSAFLTLVGGMGLPMALLAIGASLHWNQTRAHIGALAYTLTAKLVILPLIVLMGANYFFPDADTSVVGVVVLLSATPNAVASYVVSCQAGVEEGFVSSMLVASTLLSIVTLPVWLYFLF